MECQAGEPVGEPLLLSKVLREQGAEAARKASEVVLPGIASRSHSGFLHSSDDGDREMFFWYWPALNQKPDAPLLIWLQGGPGGSSLFGLFAEMGPVAIDEKLQPQARKHTWNEKYQMLFIDNPVGAGFSYTGTGSGYCNNTRHCVADNLLQVLLQVYEIFPEARSGELFITGESYGGHYVPAFGARILENNRQGTEQIPLKGIAVGDGWVDPVNMIPGYPQTMFGFGLASEQEMLVIQNYCNLAVNHINAGEMLEAFNVWDEMLNGDIFPYKNYFHNITGSNNYDNIMMTNDPPEFAYYEEYLNQPSVRRAIHVGNLTYGGNAEQCERALLRDFHVSFRPELQRLLDQEGVRVLVYSGQLDVIIAASLTERALPYLQWQGQAAFAAAKRKVWRVRSGDKEVAGFVQEVPGFQRVVLRGAGHIVPFDQPERAKDMIEHLVEGRSYVNQPDPEKSPATLVV